MCVLSDYSIKERIDELFNSPISLNSIQPCSVDLHLREDLINLDGEEFNLDAGDYILQPDEFILGSTSEYVTIPNDLVAQVDGKSSIGRLGVMIHVTAGYIDAGFNGNITLEIKNISNKPFTLKKGMSICQIIFFELTTEVTRTYGDESLGSHYQNSIGTIRSRL
ncbi:MAG: dCTP deaminase [Methanobrevibacter sp.]|nr:dCTP deaminase [Methanosphaera sp.]MBR0369202.1 dCTP deaminase [Methanobrevibacter sp.]